MPLFTPAFEKLLRRSIAEEVVICCKFPHKTLSGTSVTEKENSKEAIPRDSFPILKEIF